MDKAEFPALKHEVMITSDADRMFGGSFRKPNVSVVESLAVLAPEAAKIAAMNQNIALGNL